MSKKLHGQITEFFVSRGFSTVWLGSVSNGSEYVFSVSPSELAQIDDVRSLELDLTKATRRKIWIVGYGDRGPSEVFFD